MGATQFLPVYPSLRKLDIYELVFRENLLNIVSIDRILRFGTGPSP